MWSIFKTEAAKKEISKAPKDVQEAFDIWKLHVITDGPASLVKINGYWDHALKGAWEGARSSSLNKQWRVIYVIQSEVVKVLTLRITPHDYRSRK